MAAKSTNRLRRVNAGFALIELALALALISILATMATFQLRCFADRAKTVEARSNLLSIYMSERTYFADTGQYSDSIENMTDLPAANGEAQGAYFTYTVERLVPGGGAPEGFQAEAFLSGVTDCLARAEPESRPRIVWAGLGAMPWIDALLGAADKVIICHNLTETMEVAASSWPAHEAHGDTLGECTGGDGGGGGGGKTTICHRGNTLSVGTPAVPAHLAHGDTTGACPGPPCTSGCIDTHWYIDETGIVSVVAPG